MTFSHKLPPDLEALAADIPLQPGDGAQQPNGYAESACLLLDRIDRKVAIEAREQIPTMGQRVRAGYR
jgi:hypothetical protein